MFLPNGKFSAGISDATTVSGAWSGPTGETFLSLLLWRHGASYHRGSQVACSCEQGAPGSGQHGPQGMHYVDRMELLRSQACGAPCQACDAGKSGRSPLVEASQRVCSGIMSLYVLEPEGSGA